MTCTNWVAAAGKEADGGYRRWDTGTPVVFWWFDGRDLSNTSTYPTTSYDKIKKNAVSLALDTTTVAGAGNLTVFVPLVSAILATLSF